MSLEDPSQPEPRNGLGSAALFAGVFAFVFAFVPVVGEFVAIPAAVIAVVLGLRGFARVERGVATNGSAALTGAVLGVLAGFVTFLVFAATFGPPA